MEYKEIIFETEDHVAVITLNRPQSLNAITRRMLSEIESVLTRIESDEEIGAIVLTGGKTLFSAGVDIKEIATIETPDGAHSLSEHLQRCYNRLASVQIPVVAATSGVTFGGGLELALACDFIIASDTAKFALPEINLGLMPAAGGTQSLPRLIGSARACEMMFTGRPISAKKALEIGLVNEVVTAKDLIPKVIKMATDIASKPRVALKMIKDAVQTGKDIDLESAIKYEGHCFEFLFSTHDQKEGVTAFLEKRKPNFTGR